jgi:hypothetical protein
MNKTAGTWNPDEPFISFLAAPLSFIETAGPHHPSCLIAVNELMREDWRDHLDRLIEGDHTILIDSGAYAIAAAHARKHEIALEDAFKMPLDKLDGYSMLYARYLDVAATYQDDVWGIVEIDLGGEKQKRRTREILENQGINAIPVFHPIGDSSAYLDELLENYDRICVGNLVSASRYARKRILQTLLDRRQGKSCRWIHLLGMTPSEVLCAYPFESCDSSAWLNTVRWSGYIEKACLKSVGHLPKNYQYQLGDKDSWTLGVKMGAVGAHFQERNLRQYREAMPRKAVAL